MAWKLTAIIAVVVALVLGIAMVIVSEVAPSTTSWTAGIVCASGEKLFSKGEIPVVSEGTAQGSVHWYCVPAGQPVTGLGLLKLSWQDGAVIGLNVLFGALAGLVLTVVVSLGVRARGRIAARA